MMGLPVADGWALSCPTCLLWAQTEGPDLSNNSTESAPALQVARTATQALLEFVPRLLLAVAILVVGMLLAWLLGRLIAAACRRLKLNDAAGRTGLQKAFERIGIQRDPSEVLGTVVFWTLAGITWILAIDALQLVPLTAALQLALAYLPRILIAALLVVGGLVLAGAVRAGFEAWAQRENWPYARQMGQAVYGVLAVIVLVAALDQLNIELRLFHHAVVISLAGLALAFGLSVGLGGRHIAAGWMAGHYLRQRLQPGDRVHFSGFEGTVREIGAVATVIEEEEEGLLRRRSIPNTRMLNEAIRR